MAVILPLVTTTRRILRTRAPVKPPGTPERPDQMPAQKQATSDHPIHKLLAERWSPYAFADRPVPDEDLRSVVASQGTTP
jgi:hypothetical protein